MQQAAAAGGPASAANHSLKFTKSDGSTDRQVEITQQLATELQTLPQKATASGGVDDGYNFHFDKSQLTTKLDELNRQLQQLSPESIEALAQITQLTSSADTTAVSM